MNEDSEKSQHLNNESTLSFKTNQTAELDIKAMVTGMGRKATDEELINYLSKGNDIEPISLNEAFAKYQSHSTNH